jgi:hypothetical protein
MPLAPVTGRPCAVRWWWPVVGRYSPALFALLFLFGGHLFVEMQTDIPSVRETAFQYLPYLAVLPLIAVWSYLLDGLFIGATRAREMRNAMLSSAWSSPSPSPGPCTADGNHGLWISFLLFMVLRSLTLGAVCMGECWFTRKDQWSERLILKGQKNAETSSLRRSVEVLRRQVRRTGQAQTQGVEELGALFDADLGAGHFVAVVVINSSGDKCT